MGSAIYEYKARRINPKVCIEIHNVGYIYFKSMSELDKFAKEAGFTYEFHSEFEATECDSFCRVVKREPVCMYIMSHSIIDNGNYFSSLDELPDGAKKIVIYNYGPEATCYYVVKGLNIFIFRPNNNIPELNRVY